MEIVSQKQELLGTVIEVKLLQQHSSFFSLCFNELKRIEKTYSRFLDDSELTKLNNNLGISQQVSDEFLFLLEKSLEFNEKTNGNFDITLKSTLDKLGYDKDYSFALSKDTNEKDEESLKSIEIDKENKKVLLRKEIEFGGLGKGFALDRVASILEQNDVSHYYINAGGDIYSKKAPEQEPWFILLEHPDDSKKAIGKLELDQKALASSAANRRKWKGVHHLINAKTKNPENSVKSIFVLGETGIEVDAYATALFTAGFQKGMEMSKSLPVEVFMVSNENKVFKTENFDVEMYN